MRRVAIALALALAAGPAPGKAPVSSPLPVWRPAAADPGRVPAAEPPAPAAGSLTGGMMLGPLALAVAPPPGLLDVRPTDHAPSISPLPAHRPEDSAPDAGVEVSSAAMRPLPGMVLKPVPLSLPRPRWRPKALARPEEQAPATGMVEAAEAAGTASRLAAAESPLPRPRPAAGRERIEKAAFIAAPPDPAPGSGGGALCGIPGLQGRSLPRIAAGACGIADPVRLSAVDGIALSPPALVDCTTAAALTTWLRGSLVPTVGRRGGGVAALKVAASYACRTRNNVKGARLSEHARGKAIDIGGIVLKNGGAITVSAGWRDRALGPILKALHRGACGRFGTVLGPAADSYHSDHLHFDTASYRGGSYCR